MMFERQRTGGSFVAYEAKASRTPLPILVGDREEKAHIHPEVFIREYPHIKVKSIKPADNGGNGLAVEFDPESVPVAEGSKPLNLAVLYVALPALILEHVHALRFDRGLVIPALMPWLAFSVGAGLFLLLWRFGVLSREATGALCLTAALGNRKLRPPSFQIALLRREDFNPSSGRGDRDR